MTLAELNARIDKLPLWDRYYAKHNPPLDRDLARHLRDQRFGILGVPAGGTPSPQQIEIVFNQLFPPAAQAELL